MHTKLAAPAARDKDAGAIFWAAMGGLFFLSGISGLIYEVVWIRMLTRVLGNTTSATSIVLSAYMGGLGLGSLLIGRYADRVRRPLRLYAFLELGIGVAALLSLGLSDRLLPLYRLLYEWGGESRAWSRGAAMVTALVSLLPPTILMGATLPVLCVFGGDRPRFARNVGTLYALNCFGAVTGVLLAGFVLIGEFGESGAMALGVGLSLAVAFGAAALSRAAERPARDAPSRADGAGIDDRRSDPEIVPAGRPVAGDPASVRRVVLVTATASGFIALASQVIWGRMLLLYLGTSIYAFSAMLAVILAGMGVGGLIGGRVVGGRTDPLRLLANLQVYVGLFTLISLHLYSRGSTVKPDLSSGADLPVMAVAPVILLGPLGILWGLIFPVAVQCYTRNATARGRGVAVLYAGNTLGCIAGAAAGGFILIPWLGVSGGATTLAVASLLLALMIFLAQPGGRRPGSWAAKWVLITVFIVLLVAARDPYRLLLMRHMERAFPGGVTVYRYEESPGGTTTAFRAANDPGQRQLWIDGVGMTVLVSPTKLMAHLPLWLADDPREILVICFGMGTTVRSASRHQGLDIWAVELVPAVFQSVGLFHADGPDLLRQPNIHPVVDDGRNFLLLHPKQFDVITVDPAPPLYSAGAVNLYSREFFRLCRDRLRPGGVMCLWVPEANAPEVRAILRTFIEVFDEATIWNSPLREVLGGCYLIGARRPIREIAERVRRGFRDPAVAADLAEWDHSCDQPEKILDLFLGEGRDLAPLLADAPVITDDRPYTEFPLWRALLGRGDYYSPLNGERLRRQLMDRSRARPGTPPRGPE
jgi:spermidine synthase